MEDELWSIYETSFDPAFNRAYEGLFTVSSGFLHLRGSLEEHLHDAPQNLEYARKPTNVTAERFLETKAKWGTYIPAIRGAHPLLNRGIVNLPFFLLLAPYFGDEKLDMEASRIEDYRRSLLLRQALLRRSLTWHTRQGRRLRVVFERFVSAARPHLCVQQLSLFLLPPQVSAGPLEVSLHAGLDADVRTSGFDPFTQVELANSRANGITCHVATNTGDQVWMETRLPELEWHYALSGRTADLSCNLEIPEGGTLIIEKRTAVTSSFDLEGGLSPTKILDEAQGLLYADLLAEHTRLWEQRWQAADVTVEGDETSQLALRASLYHLLRAHPEDGRLAIDPKGYSGDAYRGCYFWDTEMYLLPFYLYTDLRRARQLLEYRLHSLPGAMANAANTGYIGARYAWEADVDGTETCPNWQYRDHEVHVTADVVYALAHYARASGEAGFLKGPAAAVIREAARFWLDRLDWRAEDGFPSLLGVMGPDEYTPISSNNSFTNRMAAFALDLAAKLGPQIGATEDECRQFAEAAAGLPILRSPDGGLVLQCEEFEHLAEPAFDRFWTDRSRGYGSQAPQEWLYRSKCLKQADVLMLMMVFASEFSDAEVRCAWSYYLPYTTHDSSLSAGVHAILACRLGEDELAWKFFQRGVLNDLEVAHGGAAEGVHIAGAGLNWQVVVFGFGGLSTVMNSETLCLRPRLPQGWQRLAFPLVWKSCPVFVEIDHSSVRLTNRGQVSLPVQVYGQEALLAPGENWIYRDGQDAQEKP